MAAAAALQHLVEQDLQIRLPAGIRGHEVGLATGGVDALQALFGLRSVATDEDDFRAGHRVAFGDGAAEFTGAADHDGGLILKREKLENGGHGRACMAGRVGAANDWCICPE